jgi:cellobiose phosphorylase
LPHRELHRTVILVLQHGGAADQSAGREAPTHGEGENSWLAGTAAWNCVIIPQWISGIHPNVDGLQITPVIPSTWNGFDAVLPVQDPP